MKPNFKVLMRDYEIVRQLPRSGFNADEMKLVAARMQEKKEQATGSKNLSQGPVPRHDSIRAGTGQANSGAMGDKKPKDDASETSSNESDSSSSSDEDEAEDSSSEDESDEDDQPQEPEMQP